ncbi:MAG TPA: DUF1156 domain-containing protein [Pirellulales bacterium]|nr:DUF1156 domain-containing protein [Pirellulales bacterium]
MDYSSPYPKRLIEVDLPIKRISAHARREKSIRHGHISTLHIWWARRPLAACRAVICASLWPDPADPNCPQAFRDAAARVITEFANKVIGQGKIKGQSLLETCSAESLGRWEGIVTSGIPLDPTDGAHQNVLRFALLDFIADFSNWDNSTVPAYLEAARALTQAAHEALGGEPGTRPLVVDPFAGGGSIPLEALRVGADAFASDLNPVAVLLNKVVLEYVPKYGIRLAAEVRKWGAWLTREAEQELARFYPKDPNGASPIAYLWARTIRCEGPGCAACIPLIRSTLLADKGKQSIHLNLSSDPESKQIAFKLQAGPRTSGRLNPVLRRSSVTCPVCGFTTPALNVRNQFKGRQGGAADARLVAVVTTTPHQPGRNYRLPESHDEAAVKKAVKELDQLRQIAPNDVPDEPLPYLRSIFNIHLLDVTKWSSLFTPRQLLALITLTRLVKRMNDEIEKAEVDPELRGAIVTCLALAVDRVAAQFSSLSWWQPKGEFVVGTFGRQALGIIWDFAEIRPVNGASGDLDGAIDWVARVIDNIGNSFCNSATVEKASATQQPLPSDSAAAVVTDPPYYDAVPYADLSDFFYVFLKRMLKTVHPSLFNDVLTPKQGEIVQLAERNTIYAFKTKEYFEHGMRDALAESRRTTVPHGIGVVVFAHKTTEGWEVMLSSIISAGWVITASWPIDTERAVRMRASNSAALASSVHLVCRPREVTDGTVTHSVGDWRDVLGELPKQIHKWMPRLAAEGVVGADAIFACLGPALEIFSRYSRVEKSSGVPVPLNDYLVEVWAAVANEALSMIFIGGDAGGLEPDARLTAMWLWTVCGGKSPVNGNTKSLEAEKDEEDETEDEEDTTKPAKAAGYVLEFDAARKIAQGLGVHLDKIQSVVEVKGDKARLLPVAERTRYLFGKNDGEEMKAPGRGKGKKKAKQQNLFEELGDVEAAEAGWAGLKGPPPGTTALDRLHQAMILFGAGRGELMKRFLVDEGVGTDPRFWKVAQSLSALYPPGSDEKRWVDGVLARKKGLGL